MGRLIDADVLYAKVKEMEDLAMQRMLDTPSSFPDGTLNPAAVRYLAQAAERTRFREMVSDATTAHPELDEWCPDCKEYDTERHCCPRFNRVIRETLADMKKERGK